MYRQHVIAHTFGAGPGRFHVVIVDDQPTQQGVHREAQQGRKEADLKHDPKKGGGRSLGNARFVRIAAGVQFHHAGGIGDGLDAGQRQHNADEAAPVFPEAAGQGCDVVHGLTQMRQCEHTQQDNHQHGGNRYQERQAAGVFGTEVVEGTDNENGHRGQQYPGCGKPKYENADNALMAAVTM